MPCSMELEKFILRCIRQIVPGRAEQVTLYSFFLSIRSVCYSIFAKKTRLYVKKLFFLTIHRHCGTKSAETSGGIEKHIAK